MKINYSNISPDLIKLAQESLKTGNSISQAEYDKLITSALSSDRQLTRDEQLFIASLDNKSVISQLLSAKFNPKGLSFDIDKQDQNNPSLLVYRLKDGKAVSEKREVRTISSQQTLEWNLSKGKEAVEYAKKL